MPLAGRESTTKNAEHLKQSEGWQRSQRRFSVDGTLVGAIRIRTLTLMVESRSIGIDFLLVPILG